MRGDTGGNRTPQWHKIRIEQTHGAESDHRDREDSETYARDAHRRGLRVTIQFNGNLMNASSSPSQNIWFGRLASRWLPRAAHLRARQESSQRRGTACRSSPD